MISSFNKTKKNGIQTWHLTSTAEVGLMLAAGCAGRSCAASQLAYFAWAGGWSSGHWKPVTGTSEEEL